MKRTELLTKLEGVDRAIETAKEGRRRLTRKMRALRGERLAVLSLLGGGVESPTRKTAPRGERGGEVRKGKTHDTKLPRKRRTVKREGGAR